MTTAQMTTLGPPSWRPTSRRRCCAWNRQGSCGLAHAPHRQLVRVGPHSRPGSAHAIVQLLGRVVQCKQPRADDRHQQRVALQGCVWEDEGHCAHPARAAATQQRHGSACWVDMQTPQQMPAYVGATSTHAQWPLIAPAPKPTQPKIAHSQRLKLPVSRHNGDVVLSAVLLQQYSSSFAYRRSLVTW